MKEKVTEIATELGWTDLGPQINGMASFTRDMVRANFYLSTRTLTLQDMNKKFDPGVSHKNVTVEEVREILK